MTGVSGSGVTPLTQRLVEAAGEAVFNEIKKWPTPPPFSGALPGFAGATQQDVGRRAAVAVLMELAQSGQVAWADSLAGLADSIERGE